MPSSERQNQMCASAPCRSSWLWPPRSPSSSGRNAIQNPVGSLLATAVLSLVLAVIGDGARAAVLDAPIGLRTAADELSVIETVQFFWQGRRYCWVRPRLAWPGLVLVWLSLAPGLRLGRSSGMAGLAPTGRPHQPAQSAGREPTRRQSTGREPARWQSARREPARRQPAKREPARRQPAGRKSPRKQSAGNQSTGRQPARQTRMNGKIRPLNASDAVWRLEVTAGR